VAKQQRGTRAAVAAQASARGKDAAPAGAARTATPESVDKPTPGSAEEDARAVAAARAHDGRAPPAAVPRYPPGSPPSSPPAKVATQVFPDAV